ncbi:COG3014 family protein [Shewanella indica]|uniref:COG3014 family protein n=1 Tax=Shewanella indica TaxID=768528 RepID=UPI003999DD42
MKSGKLLLPLLLSLSLTGCAFNSVLVNYPSQLAGVRAELNSSKPGNAAKELANGINGRDGLLYAQEAGRAAQISGNFAASKDYYQSAIAAYQAFDDKAKLSLSGLGSQGGSLLLNDNIIPYRGPGYERIMLHQYQALNYLFAGDAEGALVEVRRSNELQSLEQQRYEKSSSAVQQMANGTISAEMDKLGKAAGNVTSSFLNAYSYYTTGVLHEILGERNDAFIDYRKAAQIMPNNPYLQQDLVRLAKELAMPQYGEFKRRWGEAPSPAKGQGQVILLLERGFVPAKESLTVPFTIHGNWQTVSLPTYMPSRVPVNSAHIRGLSKPMTAAPIANIDALAITALKEELPYLLVRQAARVYAKSEMARKAERKDGSDLGVIAMQIFNVVTEQADRRSWLTLPRQAQIARQFVDAGSYQLTLDNQGTEIQVQSGKTTLVWAIDTGNVTRFYTKLI